MDLRHPRYRFPAFRFHHTALRRYCLGMTYATLIDLLRTTEALRKCGPLGGTPWTRGSAVDSALDFLASGVRSDAEIRDAAALLLLALEANHAAR